jgi:hypothetical protein
MGSSVTADRIETRREIQVAAVGECSRCRGVPPRSTPTIVLLADGDAGGCWDAEGRITGLR